MSTDTYTKLKTFCGGRQIDISDRLEISAPAICQWKGVIPLAQAEAVERLTGGVITVGEVVSDWHRAREARARD